MKPHYFAQDHADEDDMFLMMAIQEDYVPATCLLGGELAYGLGNEGKDPCKGCAGPREKCRGRPEKEGNLDSKVKEIDYGKAKY